MAAAITSTRALLRPRGRPARLLCTAPTAAQLLASSQRLTDALASPPVVAQLEHVRDRGDALTKWVTCNMQLTQQAAVACQGLPSFGPDPTSVGRYLELLLGGAEPADADDASREALREHHRVRWSMLLNSAFRCELGPRRDREEARGIVIGMVDALQAPGFLSKVSDLMRGELMGQLSPMEKQQAVARLMIMQQKEAIVPFGYDSSDQGYAQAQAALQEHALDAVIQGSIMHVTQRVYLSAGIDMQELMRTLSGGAGTPAPLPSV